MGYRIINQNELHYLTFTVVGWVDVFTRELYCEIIIESFHHCIKNKGLQLYAFVIMSNHIHLIVKTDSPAGLSSIIRDFKAFTSNHIIKKISNSRIESRKEWLLKMFEYYAKYNKRNNKYQFWKQDNHAIELGSAKWISQKLVYIHLNPVRSGIVNKPESYKYSSAQNYLGLKGVIDITLFNEDDLLL